MIHDLTDWLFATLNKSGLEPLTSISLCVLALIWFLSKDEIKNWKNLPSERRSYLATILIVVSLVLVIGLLKIMRVIPDK